MATRHDFQIDDEPYSVSVDAVGGGLRVSVDGGAPVEIAAPSVTAPALLTIMRGGEPIPVYVTREGRFLRVIVEGRSFLVRPGGAAGRPRNGAGSSDPLGQILAPLAGVAVDIRVAVGDHVEAHDVVVVIEAMKMQNEVQSPLAGTVTAVPVERGVRVEKSDLLVEYTPDEE